MTSAISSFVPPVAPQMPPQAAASSPSSLQPGFSQMLSQAQSREAEAPAAEAAPEAPASKPARPAHSAERGRGEKAGKADKVTKSDSEGRAEKAEADAQAVDAGGTAEAPHDTPVVDPALADWLAALQRPAAPTPEAVAAKGVAAEGEAGTDPALLPKGGAARGGPGAATAKDLKAQDAAEQARETQAKAAEPTRAVAETSSFQAALAQVDNSHRELKPVQELPSMPHLAAAGMPPAAGASRGNEITAPVPVQVPTPTTSPEFAQSLGVQVSVLARDGIQHAELHLNPAEMGPISVQIAIDGTQAQVNFGADVAATRQIIENGLPELAASLREAGFTLSGGGVHSQARGREQGDDAKGERGEPSGARAIGASEADVTPHRVVSRVSAGGVDLYA
jgi:flagellar hook-length control protein FliK